MPGIVSLYEGEIIDSFGGQSGQLDGILVHATGSALATAPNESRVVLAEGALGVLESKSSLQGQWSEVHRTWRKVSELRRFKMPVMPPPSTAHEPLSSAKEVAKRLKVRARRARLGSHSIPLFVVIGREGWQTGDTLSEKAQELSDTCPLPGSTIMVMQLQPPGYAVKRGVSAAPQTEMLTEVERWQTICLLWAKITDLAGREKPKQIRWPGYLGD